MGDACGTGASFGTRTGELSEQEIKDYGELIDWIAGQPWSSGRIGVYGTSYEGQAAELIAGLGNAHLLAVAALFSPHDPYRELFYPGGCGTDSRFARWMYESQLKDSVRGALDRLAAITGQPSSTIAVPAPVKPVDGPDGPALLDAAIEEHQANADVHALMGQVPFRDDRVPGLDWEATAPPLGQRWHLWGFRCWSALAGSTADSQRGRWHGSWYPRYMTGRASARDAW